MTTSHRWVDTRVSVQLIYIALIAVRSVGAITPNNSTSSISDIHTLPLGMFTQPDSLIVIIVRSMPILFRLQTVRLLYSQTMIYRVQVLCLLPLRKSALW